MNRRWICLVCTLSSACGSSSPPPPASAGAAPAPRASAAARPSADADQPAAAAATRATADGPAPAARAGAEPSAAPGKATAGEAALFERLGGLPAIKAVVEEFVARTTTDKRIKERFFNTDATHLKAMLVEQVCEATGGPCKYSGRDMKTAHARMQLVDEEFDALVEDLTGALDKFKVPEREKGELLGALAGLKSQVVVPPGQLRPLSARKLASVEHLAGRVKNPRAVELLAMAVIAGRRGQRSYAEQLFSRAELLAGARPLASIAAVFRSGAPPRVKSPLRSVSATSPAQPKLAVGNSDDDDDKAAAARPAPSTLKGKILVNGAPLSGVGVVMLEPADGKFKPRVAKKRVIEQRDRRFAPRILAAPVGSTVSFPNFDPIYHNVFSLSSGGPFDLGLYASGETRDVTFKKEGIVRIGCNIHSSMAAFLIIVSAPHYAVADASGAFAFRRLTPGRYRLKAWSERSAEPTVQQIEIKPGANQISVALAGDASDWNPDKFGDAR